MSESQSEYRKEMLRGPGAYGPNIQDEYRSSSEESDGSEDHDRDKTKAWQSVNAEALTPLFGSIRVDPKQKRVYFTGPEVEYDAKRNRWDEYGNTHSIQTQTEPVEEGVFEHFDTDFDFAEQEAIHSQAEVVTASAAHHPFEYDSEEHSFEGEIIEEESGSESDKETGTATREYKGGSWWEILKEQGDSDSEKDSDSFIRSLKMSGVGDAADMRKPDAKSVPLGDNYPHRTERPETAQSGGSPIFSRNSSRPDSQGEEKQSADKKQRIRFKGVTAHPSTKNSFFSGRAVAAFVHKFRQLPKERCLRWFLRSKEILHTLWDEARIDSRDRTLFYTSHCTGGFTISKAVAVAMHIQLLTVHLTARDLTNWLIDHRNKAIYSLKRLLMWLIQKYEDAKTKRREELEKRKAPLLGFDVTWEDQKGNMLTTLQQIETRALLLRIVKLTVQTVEQIIHWRRTLWRPQPFLYNGRNYLKQMTRDVCFLDMEPARSILKDMRIPVDEIEVITAFSCTKYGIPRRETETDSERVQREETRRRKIAEYQQSYNAQRADVQKQEALDKLRKKSSKRENTSTTPDVPFEFPSPDEELPQETEMLDAPRSILDGWTSKVLLPSPEMIHKVDHAISALAMERGLQYKLKAEAVLLAERNMFIPCIRWRLPPRKDCLEVPIDIFEKHPEDMTPSQAVPTDYAKPEDSGAYAPLTVKDSQKNQKKWKTWEFQEDYYSYDEQYAEDNDIYTAEMDEVTGNM